MTTTTELLTVTDEAIKHIAKWIQKEQGLGVRISVNTTGCSGLAYHTEIIHDAIDNDNTLMFSNAETNITIYIDPKAEEFIKGSKIDYIQEGLASRLTFNNPQEKGRCGCGESFTV